MSDNCKTMIASMLSFEESARPSCLELIRGQYFESVISDMRDFGLGLLTPKMIQNLREFRMTSVFQKEIVSK